ncbi:MAG: transglycosylase SLT domain-containing protein [Cytophagaceae bacterium]
MEKVYVRRFILLLVPLLFLNNCGSNYNVEDSEVFSEARTNSNMGIDSAEMADVKSAQPLEGAVLTDIEEIKARGTLIALTGYSHTGYFIYKGTPMGYEYDLLKRLADHLNVNLAIKIVRNHEEMFRMLKEGEGDIIAYNLAVTKKHEDFVNFTTHHSTGRQVLVQKKPNNWQRLSKEKLNSLLVRDPLDLIGKEVYVRKNSAHHLRVMNLSNEIGGDIDVVPVNDETDVEDLILKVAEGEIPYTIADEQVALLNQSYFPDLDVSTPISFKQRFAWAVRKSSPELLNEVNGWIHTMKRKPVYYIIYNKYFKHKKGIDQRIRCSREMTCGKSISPYDSLIQKYAHEINWDWRLLASLVYQESRFDPEAQSWAGASGLMQLMPATAKEFGAQNPFDAEDGIAAGAKYLKWLDRYWMKKVPDPEERLKFILASYNVGQEHVADAVRLASKYQRLPDVWDGNVAYFVLNKSKPKYSNDPVVRYGYCRGAEPFNYVNAILDRYQHYKNLIDEESL